MKKHSLDKPILRNLFWFIVLPYQLKQWKDGHCKYLGEARTVGELKKMLEDYPDSTSFGFHNQPMQTLHEIKYQNDKYVVFQ